MKKFALLLLALAGSLRILADGFSYLTFETTDGEKVSVAVDESLELSISGTTLTVGSNSFTLSNLSKMYFTDADETATGIESIQNSSQSSGAGGTKFKIQNGIENYIDDDAEVYDLRGRKFVNGKSSNRKLPHGVYLVKTKQETYKIVVK